MNKLYNSNFFDISFPPNTFDLVILDLPYGQTKYAWDKQVSLDKLWEWLLSICKNECLYIFFTTAKFGRELLESRPKAWFKYDLVWEKSRAVGFLSANKISLRKHELIYIFGDPKYKHTYNPVFSSGEPYKTNRRERKASLYGSYMDSGADNKGTRYPSSVLEYNSVFNTIHGTQKPVDLLEYLIKLYSNKGDNVLDPTMGSGSTIIACLNTGRNCVGIELNKKIYNSAVNRISNSS